MRSILTEDAGGSRRKSSTNFKVVLRIRPQSQLEIEKKQIKCVSRVSDTVVCIERPPELQRGPAIGAGRGSPDRRADRMHTFTYDRVFQEEDDQQALFEVAA
eukprot:CAMPEP_0206294638 /NCGR_PEP_ID=MMETSP0106_2-20121207/4761_1 /ASSEMBLY_ACC=CAM_ASM_000206 /TAXON_ID=81532 /ORGANISM="Acanthoeca-like sp., Strain 10tr" /LENGTH=101 /DNA_ID=CAMNT_0053725281 /DNA_START=311 /DNA_END=613 /DNA_ORIENTATION=+